MAISKSFRKIYDDDGKAYYFSTIAFKNSITRYCSDKRKADINMTQELLTADLSEKISKSTEAIRKWIKGENGPNDIEVVKDIAEFFDQDYKYFLVPSEKMRIPDKVIEIDASQHDEKGLVLEFHKMLSDFIYDYIGGDFRNVYVERRYWDSLVGDIDEEINDYIFNAYKQLERIALEISTDTYNKLHRFITECKVFATVGYIEATPKMASLVKINPRWIKANPYLEKIADYSRCMDFDEERFLNYKDSVDALIEPFKKEASGISFSFGVKEARRQFENPIFDAVDTTKLIDENELHNYYFYEPYEAVPMELAKTLTLLFKQDFPQYFGNN